MFHFFASVASFVPDENGELVAIDSPLLQIEPAIDSTPPDYAMASIKMFLTFIAIALLFGATVWFLKRLIRQRLERGSGAQSICVLEKKMISPKTMLYVIDVDGERMVIAESQLEVRQLKTVPIETKD